MDQSPTALFDSYDSDFQQVSESIRIKLEDEAKSQQGGLQIMLIELERVTERGQQSNAELLYVGWNVRLKRLKKWYVCVLL